MPLQPARLANHFAEGASRAVAPAIPSAVAPAIPSAVAPAVAPRGSALAVAWRRARPVASPALPFRVHRLQHLRARAPQRRANETRVTFA
eukprot:3529462-Prymnesium_polylepis.1